MSSEIRELSTPRAALSLDRDFLRAFFLLGVVLAPLPFGSTRPWAWMSVTLCVGIALCILGIMVGLRRFPAVALTRYLVPLLIPAIIVAGWALLQAVMPAALLGGANPLWDLAASALHVPLEPRVSVNPAASLNALVKLLTYYAVFYLAFVLAHERGAASHLLWILVVCALLYSLFGIANHLINGSARTLFFVREEGIGKRFGLSSTFIYANGFAAYAALGLLVAAYLLVEAAQRRVPSGLGVARSALFVLKTRGNGSPLFLVFAIVLFFGCIVASLSRGVTISAVAALLALVAAVSVSGQTGGVRRFTFLAVAALCLGAIFLATGGIVGDRLGMLGQGLDSRTRIYGYVLAAFQAAPWTGWGLGTFRDVFPLFQDSAERLVFNEAHSTILEFAVDLGIVGAIAAVAPFVYLAGFYLWVLVRRGSRNAALGLAACLFALIQGAFDFTLQIPAVGLTMAAVLGVTYSQCVKHLRPSGEGTRRKSRSRSRS